MKVWAGREGAVGLWENVVRAYLKSFHHSGSKFFDGALFQGTADGKFPAVHHNGGMTDFSTWEAFTR